MDAPTKTPATGAAAYPPDNEIQQVEKPLGEARFLQIVAKPDQHEREARKREPEANQGHVPEKFPDENCSGPDYERWVAYRRKKEQQLDEVAYEPSPTKIRNLNLIIWRLLDNNSDTARSEWGDRQFLTEPETKWLQSVDR